MAAKRRTRSSHSRTVARIPEQALPDRVLELAAPLLEQLEAGADSAAISRAVELAIEFWNASAEASGIWGRGRTKALDTLRRALTGRGALPEDAERFALLVERWRALQLGLDPRLVGEWSLVFERDGALRLSCEMELPKGVEAEDPLPIESRIAIGGKFLDEVGLRAPAGPNTVAYVSHPPQNHRGAAGADGSVTVHTKMATAVVLLAQGVLPPIGSRAVKLAVHGHEYDAMVLSEVRRDDVRGGSDEVTLVFQPEPAPSGP